MYYIYAVMPVQWEPVSHNVTAVSELSFCEDLYSAASFRSLPGSPAPIFELTDHDDEGADNSEDD